MLLLHALPPCLAVLELLVDGFQQTSVAESQVVRTCAKDQLVSFLGILVVFI